MQQSNWYVVTIVLPPAAAEEMADWIRLHLDVEPVQLEQPGANHIWLESYFATPGEASMAAEQVRRAEQPIHTVAIRRCDARDWHTFWQKHFKSQRIGQRLYLCPSWEEVQPDGQACVILRITPGLSFGTGDHFTTRFCLEMIDRLSASINPCKSLWDAGCGSGILAVAGALLGMQPVLGTDSDPVCLDQARANATLNNVLDRAEWKTADILVESDAPQRTRYDLVCANLFANLLQQAAEILWSRTGRYLALSGIREMEVDGVAETYRSLGAYEIVRDGDGEWAGLLFERKEPAG